MNNKTIRIAVVVALAASLAFSSVGSVTTQAFGEERHREPDRGDHTYTVDPNMDIRGAYKYGDYLIVQVAGIAGGTTPPAPEVGHFGQVYVYAFVTDAGIMVINAHWECHTGATGCDPNETHVSAWHAEFVTLGHVDGHEKDCVTSIYGERTAKVIGSFGIVNVPEAHKILQVQTAAFDLQMDPDTAPSAASDQCVAELDHVFDTWTPSSYAYKDD